MPRLAIIFAALALTAAGCSSEELTFGTDRVKAVAAAVGDIVHADREALRAAMEHELGAAVSEVKAEVDEATGEVKALKATLPPLAAEVAAEGGKTLLDKIGDNPTTSGILGGALAALTAGLGVIARRSRLRREAAAGKAAQPPPAVAPPGGTP